MCVVLGGPEYRFNFTGESSTVGFLLDRSVLDFKQVIFTSRKDEELLITNTGKVVFDYAVSGSANAMGLFDVTPISGSPPYSSTILLCSIMYQTILYNTTLHFSLLCEITQQPVIFSTDYINSRIITIFLIIVSF